MSKIPYYEGLITMMKGKNDFTQPLAFQPVEKSTKTSGDLLFDSTIFEADKNQIDNSYLDVLISKSNSQTKKAYELQKFILDEAKNTYIDNNKIKEIFNSNCDDIIHIKTILESTYPDKIIKIVLLILKTMSKSNFWISLWVYELLKEHGITVDFIVEDICEVKPNVTGDFSNFANEHYLIIISDDISYSGSQIEHHSITNIPMDPNHLTLFLNLIGYSENAKKKIESRIKQNFSSQILTNCYFGSKSIFPLPKLSSKFKDNEPNNVIKKKADVCGFSQSLSALIYSDAWIIGTDNNIIPYSFYLFRDWESNNMSSSRNGSLQYLPFKYPDWLSTVDKMCKTNKMQNLVIFRFDRLITHYNIVPIYYSDDIPINEDGTIPLESQDVIDKFDDFSLSALDNGIIQIKTKTYDDELQLNFDDLFHSQLLNIPQSVIIEIQKAKMITQKLKSNGKSNPDYSHNMILNRFTRLNNKINKFNKKHLIEIVPSVGEFFVHKTTKFNIRNCGTDRIDKINSNESNICSKNCKLSFYKQINWK